MQQVMDKLRPQIAQLPRISGVHEHSADHQHRHARIAAAAYEFTHAEHRYGCAGAWHRKSCMAAVEKESDLVLDVNTDLQIKNPRVNVKIDRERAASLGLNAKQIENALYSGYGPKWTTNIYSPTNQYEVLVEMQQKYQA